MKDGLAQHISKFLTRAFGQSHWDFFVPHRQMQLHGAVGVVQGASMAYHRSDPLPAQEQDQLVPKLFTTDVCLSSYSKNKQKMMEM